MNHCETCRNWVQADADGYPWRLCVLLTGVQSKQVAKLATSCRTSIYTTAEFGCVCWEASTAAPARPGREG